MDKNSYALGMSIAHNLLASGVKDLTKEDFVAGLTAVLEGKETEVPFDEAARLLDAYFAEIQAAQQEQNSAAASMFREEGRKFLEENAKKEGVVVLPSGLQYKVITEGSGKMPAATDKVKCHYEGTLTDGTKFDSSYDRKQPAVFGLNQVIPGWTEGVQLMNEGAKYEFYIPFELGYGEAGAHGAIPPCAALVFIVELIEVL